MAVLSAPAALDLMKRRRLDFIGPIRSLSADSRWQCRVSGLDGRLKLPAVSKRE
jgi:hypothetical protein